MGGDRSLPVFRTACDATWRHSWSPLGCPTQHHNLGIQILLVLLLPMVPGIVPFTPLSHKVNDHPSLRTTGQPLGGAENSSRIAVLESENCLQVLQVLQVLRIPGGTLPSSPLLPQGFWKIKVNATSALMRCSERRRSRDLGLLKVKWIFECKKKKNL